MVYARPIKECLYSRSQWSYWENYYSLPRMYILESIASGIRLLGMLWTTCGLFLLSLTVGQLGERRTYITMYAIENCACLW